jgi:hypothetical protein
MAMPKGTEIKIKAWWLANEEIEVTVINDSDISDYVLVRPAVGCSKLINKSAIVGVLNGR